MEQNSTIGLAKKSISREERLTSIVLGNLLSADIVLRSSAPPMTWVSSGLKFGTTKDEGREDFLLVLDLKHPSVYARLHCYDPNLLNHKLHYLLSWHEALGGQDSKTIPRSIFRCWIWSSFFFVVLLFILIWGRGGEKQKLLNAN